MTLVVDASVLVKWLLADPEREAETAQATRVMRAVAEGPDTIVQPVHWLVEVGAVLARLSPETAEQDLAMLEALELPVDEAPEITGRACRLAIDLGQHLFDTLYHAVALEQAQAMLITADRRYLKAARNQGRVMHLSEWRPDAAWKPA